MPTFSHLHCHTQFSLLDGAANISDMMKKAQADGMPAVALTDHGNMFGAFKFVAEANKYNVKPIVGCEFYLVEDRHKKTFNKESKDNRHHQLLLAKDQNGYKNLAKLCSLGYIEGMYSKWPRIDKEILLKYKEGLIATTCCIGAEVPQAILNQGEEEAEKLFRWWLDLFGDDYYVELQRHKMEQQEKVNAVLLKFAKKYNVKVIASNDSHYLNQDDYNAHDILLCVNTGELQSKPVWKGDGFGGREFRFGFPNDQFYFKKTEEMARLFHDLPQALDNTNEIVDKITPPKLKRDILLPNFPLPPQFATADDYLYYLTFEGAKKRYNGLPLTHEDTSSLSLPTEVTERLEHELRIIKTMGFAGYFLIVQDFIAAGRKLGVAVGPGRGSAAGSAVAYCIGITNIDPIKYSLLFERFLNPERISMPDIDIDFDDQGRQQVIDYVVDKYGKNQVAQIVTFGTMAAKSSIKDVARVLDLPLPQSNKLANLVPTVVGMTLPKAFSEVPELQELRKAKDINGEVLQLAEKLEGSVRNTGIHAAGVIIAPDDLTDYIPVFTSKDSELFVTQFDGKHIEDAGMLKMDFLGLKTLTIIKDALAMIKKNHGVDIDIDAIPMDDPKTFELYQRGDTVGTFQFESEGMRMYLKDLKPTNIEDLIAMNALYRPGPMQFIPNFINRKHGKEEVIYPHDLLEPILNYTYGIMVYQEQIMQTAQILAGYSLGGADLLRRAMGKKDKEKMAKERVKFVKGAKEIHSIPDKKAEEVFDVMEKFAEYGFNRCLTGDATVMDALTGKVFTMQEIHETRPQLSVHALGQDGKLHIRPVTDTFYNGVKPVFELRTRQGKQIRATANHPLRTLNGWVTLENLRPGDRIAAPRSLPVHSTQRLPDHELITLAGLLSEGNTCHPSCLYFFNNDLAFAEDFAVAVRQFPDTVARIYYRSDKRLEVCVSTGRKFRFGLAADKKLPSRSGAFLWAQSLGILGKKASGKYVPKVIFSLCNENISLFLGRLWSGDGFISNVQEHTPWYATSSKQLAQDVQMLLLRLGIQSGIHTKQFKYRNTLRTGYTVRLVGEDAAEEFLSRIVPHIIGRDQAVSHLRNHVDQTMRGLTSKDTIPHQVREWVNQERTALGLTWVQLESLSGVCAREFTGNGSRMKKAFRWQTLARLAAYFSSVRLLNIAQSDIFWDEIVSITPAGEAATYDLTVAEDHNFVANGLVVHNSHSAAYSVVAYQTAYLKANYPAEYMASVLTHWMGNIEKITFFMDECRKQNIPVLGPDVNESARFFNVNKEGKIRFGLGAIKGTGDAAVDNIIEERGKEGSFKDFFDFARRVNLRAVNKRTFESLAYSGAFDGFGNIHRAQYFFEADGANLIEKAIKYGNSYLQAKGATQQSLFSFGGNVDVPTPRIPVAEPWSEIEKLKYEKEVVGFYISGHPLDQFKLEIENFCSDTIDNIENYKNKEICIAGIVTKNVVRQGRNGNPFALFSIEDYNGSLDMALFGEDYVNLSKYITVGQFVYIKGKVQLRYGSNDQWEVKPTQIQLLSELRKKLCKGLHVNLDLARVNGKVVEELARIAQSQPGDCYLKVVLHDTEDKMQIETIARKFKVFPTNELIDQLSALEGLSYKLIW